MGVVLKLGGLGVDELMSINTTKGDFCKEHRPPQKKTKHFKIGECPVMSLQVPRF